MNNLLRTLTTNEVKASLADKDLKLLLSNVKRYGPVSDAFYDSLEGLLNDLRAVTMDNHDADAFLKPVSKADVPDYYDVISTPMDLQTMLRKVKSKHYKSKKEFKDDLDLIWHNCLTYNASPEHPLRQCARRLQIKSEKLLKNITDRKERADPHIPTDLPGKGPLKPNGVNGHVRSQTPKSVIRIPPIAIPRKRSSAETTFSETTALIRTAEGMANFKSLESDQSDIEARLRAYTLQDTDEPMPDVESDDDHSLGDKRKLNGDDPRPRKRSRTSSTSTTKHHVEIWWDIVQSDHFLANGLPSITHSSSDPTPQPKLPPATNKRKKRKKTRDADPPKTMLGLMNNNIRTMHRLRHVHVKFSSIKDATSNNNDDGLALPSFSAPPPLPDPAADLPTTSLVDTMSRLTDENPWSMHLRATGVAGIDVGREEADRCLNWMGTKVLEHVGFQGSSKVAMEVLAGVASEYLLNVGRTIQYLSNKYARKMSSEEIILHTLFESGITRVDDLERYIQDDVVRYGGRITELEKKLDNAYREAASDEADLDDDALFRFEDDEDNEDNAFVMGDYGGALGDDFFGLRELGIAGELGLTNLTVPKKLMKAKPGLNHPAVAAKPKEPPLPFPPPPPFVPLTSNTVEERMIGLLRPYYKNRFDALAGSALSKPGGVEGEEKEGLPMMELLDDVPSAVQIKMNPLGQIPEKKPAAGAGPRKKVKKEKEAPLPDGGASGAAEGGEGGDGDAPKKRGGPGRGKKGKMSELALAQRGGVVVSVS